MLKLVFLLLSLSLLNYEQSTIFCVQDENADLYLSIYVVNYQQGGMQVPDEMKKEQPLGNYKMLLVQYFGPDIIPEVMDTIKTNSKGVFHAKLKKGKYGVVLLSEGNELQIGQFLPKVYHKEDEGWRKSSTWEITNNAPIIIKVGQVSRVKLVHYQTSICKMCP